ncbi:MAG TPA: hemagglutinin repeat-containing protein, partial [Holophaga sp.]|nr:hemagglutinin repeat-containing protein [Holophaga sp.]
MQFTLMLNQRDVYKLSADSKRVDRRNKGAKRWMARNQWIGSTIIANGDLNITATGGDLSAQGATLLGQNIALEAAKNLDLASAVDTTSNRSKNSSSSASVGVSFGVGQGSAGLSLDVAVSLGKGVVNGDTSTNQNTVVTAKNGLTLRSGGDTNLKGAVASGKSVTVNTGGDLNIASQQDTGTYAASQESAGVAVSVPIMGAGGSVSANMSQSKTNSNYKSVNQQSGILAGEGGFQIEVAGNTDLKGAVITSQAKPTENSLVTGTLTTSDIQNQMVVSSSTSGFGISSSVVDSKYESAKMIGGNLLDHGHA